MTKIISPRLSLVLAILVSITLLSWGVGHGFEGRWITAIAVLGLASAKIAVVFSQFMDVRHAPLWLKALAYGWTGGVCVILLAAYFYGAQVAPYMSKAMM